MTDFSSIKRSIQKEISNTNAANAVEYCCENIRTILERYLRQTHSQASHSATNILLDGHMSRKIGFEGMKYLLSDIEDTEKLLSFYSILSDIEAGK